MNDRQDSNELVLDRIRCLASILENGTRWAVNGACRTCAESGESVRSHAFLAAQFDAAKATLYELTFAFTGNHPLYPKPGAGGAAQANPTRKAIHPPESGGAPWNETGADACDWTRLDDTPAPSNGTGADDGQTPDPSTPTR